MFESMYIGKKDIYNRKIKESDVIQFQSISHNNKVLQGTVKYMPYACKFIICRKDDFFEFNADVTNVKIIDV